jgi:hypothetical protein
MKFTELKYLEIHPNFNVIQVFLLLLITLLYYKLIKQISLNYIYIIKEYNLYLYIIILYLHFNICMPVI